MNKFKENKERLIFKVFGIILILALCFSMIFALVACTQPENEELDKPKEKRAILILPGLMASGYYDTTDNSPVWDPFGETQYTLNDLIGNDLGTVVKDLMSSPSTREEVKKVLSDKSDSFLYRMALNDDGTPKNPSIIPAVDYDGRQQFGPLNAYYNIYTALNDRYGDKYTVKVYSYDFRMTCEYNADKLEKYINEQGYEDVILVGHSYGCMVSSTYLIKEENRNKVRAFVSLVGPYEGALTAITIQERVTDFFKELKDIPVIGASAKTVLDNQLYPLAERMTSIPQMLPSYELLYGLQNELLGGKPCFEIDGVTIASDEDLYNFYLTRPWAKALDADGNRTGDVRPVVRDWLKFRQSFYIDTPDGKKHSTELVNTLFIASGGRDTEAYANYAKEGDKVVYVDSGHQTASGDGTLLTYSGSRNLPLDAKNVVYCEGVEHNDCGCLFPEKVSTPVCSFLDEIINK